MSKKTYLFRAFIILKIFFGLFAPISLRGLSSNFQDIFLLIQRKVNLLYFFPSIVKYWELLTLIILIRSIIKMGTEEDPCYEKKCTSNEHCCEGSVCIDMEIKAVGTCMPLYGKKYGESCVRNSDCETGFVCLEGESGRMMCAEQMPGVGRFGKYSFIFVLRPSLRVGRVSVCICKSF